MSVVPLRRACTAQDASGARTGTLGRRGGRHYMYTTRGNSPCPPPLPYSRGMWLDSHTVDRIVNKHQHISRPTANVMLLHSSMSMKSRWRLTVILAHVVCFVLLVDLAPLSPPPTSSLASHFQSHQILFTRSFQPVVWLLLSHFRGTAL